MTKDHGWEVARLREALEGHTGWGAGSGWHSKMFEELSENIFDKTGVMLSPVTLKRFMGALRHDGTPSITTLDTLSQYMGFENWTAFRMAKPQKVPRRSIPGRTIYISIGFVLAVITIALLSSRRPAVTVDATAFAFSSKVLSDEYPNSVVFDIQIPAAIDTDSLHIQQYWDPTKTISVRRDQRQATGIYYFPGYFKAQLMVDGKSVLSHDLFLKSKGWLGTVDYQPVPKYFLPTPQQAGALEAPSTIDQEVRTSAQPLVTTYHFIDDLGEVSGDQFHMKATAQITLVDRWAVCQAMQVYFIGSSGAMIIPFSKIGCSSDNFLMLNDMMMSGKEHDLSAFSAQLTTPTTIEIQNEAQTVVTSIDGREVHRMAYNESMGKLVGIRFKFLGLGKVTQLEVRDQQNRIIPEFTLGAPLESL